MDQSVWVVVPCYNEAARLDRIAFARFLADVPSGRVRFLFVDDGSRDATRDMLQALVDEHPERCELLALPQNGGKAEAVRQGMLHVAQYEPWAFGYWDADLATPLDTIHEFAALLDRRDDLRMVFGARVKLLGRSVERRLLRHYFGRVFATCASSLLGLPIYDTQCGAKLFRFEPATAALFAEPFHTGWTFDVELLARWLTWADPAARDERVAAIYEYPLPVWRDVAGSKVRPWDFFRAFGSLAIIGRRYFGPARSVPRPAVAGRVVREEVPA